MKYSACQNRMKTSTRPALWIVVVALLLLGGGNCRTVVFSPRPLPGEIRIRFEGLHPVENRNTYLYFAVYDRAENFMVPGKEVFKGYHRVDSTTISVNLRGYIRPGSYAIVAFHDENGNGKLDQSEMGLPLEGFSFSNNPPLNRGKPGWKQISFSAEPEIRDISMRLVYLLQRSPEGGAEIGKGALKGGSK